MVLWIIIAAAVIAADRITKALTVSRLALGESVDVIPGVFRFTYVQNRGAAFGMLSNHRWVFILFSAVAIVGIIVYVIVKKPKDKLLMTALSLIVGGGIGNMIDRIGTGYVVDFLDFCLFLSHFIDIQHDSLFPYHLTFLHLQFYKRGVLQVRA